MTRVGRLLAKGSLLRLRRNRRHGLHGCHRAEVQAEAMAAIDQLVEKLLGHA